MANTAKVNRSLPSAFATGQDVPDRGSPYGEQYVLPMGGERTNIADEGSYFVVTTPTPGTGLATAASTNAQALDDTKATFVLFNNASAAGGKRVYMDYLKMICTAAGTAGASLNYVVKVDNGVGRFTSGGTLSAILNVNMDSSVASGCLAYGSPVVLTAATSAVRMLGHGVFRTGIPVIGDTYILLFGRHAGVGGAQATIGTMSFFTSPVVVGPQQTFCFHIFLPSQSAASSFEFEAGWWER